MACSHCRLTTSRGTVVRTPFTTEALRWYMSGAAHAAMGMRSTHQAFENMMVAGPSSGGTNLPELRMTDAVLNATGRERCIRTHRLGDVDAEHLAVLKAAYSGEDWTRTLDERVGRGPRLELHRFFTHEELQVALLASIVKKAVQPEPAKPTAAGTPVYRTGDATLSGLRRVLQLAADANEEAIRGRLSSIAGYARGRRRPSWMKDDTMHALAVLAECPHVVVFEEVVKAARKSLGKALRLAGENNVTFVATTPRVTRVITAQTYLVELIQKKRRKKLEDIREQVRKMLREARSAAGVSDPKEKRVRTSRVTPASEIPTLRSETY